MSSNPSEPEMSEPSHERNPEVTFESRDLSSRGVVGFLIALAIGWPCQAVMRGVQHDMAPLPANLSSERSRGTGSVSASVSPPTAFSCSAV